MSRVWKDDQYSQKRYEIVSKEYMYPSTLLQRDGTITSQQGKGNVQQTLPRVCQRRQKHYYGIGIVNILRHGVFIW